MRSINCARLIDFLLAEDMNHAGTANGALKATYDQLVDWGLSRSEIKPAIEEAEHLGLIRYERGGRWANSNQPSLYRLTFRADRIGNPPTDEWKRHQAKEIVAWKKDYVANRKAGQAWRKKRKRDAASRTTVVRLSELRTAARSKDGG
ncbi:MAG: hypothetical protein GY789_17380 [Hyphomicrobiales bacterium]|nr:hypothetical protein [Hyphomicrobiales bacterium]